MARSLAANGAGRDAVCLSKNRRPTGRCGPPRLLSHDGRFKVLSRHDKSCCPAPIPFAKQREQVKFERRLVLGVERTESLVHRTVIGAEDIHPVLGRSITEREVANPMLDTLRLHEKVS